MRELEVQILKFRLKPNSGKTTIRVMVVSLLTVLLVIIATVIDTTDVDAARTLQEVYSVAQAFEAAWNKHDVDVMASLYTDSADVVTTEGWTWFGRPEIKRGLAWMHTNTFKSTPIHIDSSPNSLKFVTKDTAVVIVALSVGTTVAPDGRQLPESKTMLSLFLVKRKGRWLIESFHDSAVDPQVQHNDLTKKG